MKICIVAFSEKAYQLSQRIGEGFRLEEPDAELMFIVKTEALPQLSDGRSLREICKECFSDEAVRAILFVSAAGIAVRGIAPFLQHKSKDPAVLCIDEGSHYCIPLLSGHLGGANALARKVASWIGAEAVITTASDVEGRFAIDLFAKENGLSLSDFKRAKELTAKSLRGESLRFFSELPRQSFNQLPEEGIEWLPKAHMREAEVWIGYHRMDACDALAERKALRLLARCIYIGIGARKGVEERDVEEAITACLEETGIDAVAVAALCSIDRKRGEQGILSYAYRKNLPFLTYTAAELSDVEGDFAHSDFVASIVGIGNVCERAAIRAAGTGGRLLFPKKTFPKLTAAIAVGGILA